MTEKSVLSGQTPGVPYARALKRGKRWGKVCPVCSKWIASIERKDFESFTGREYAEHYVQEHGDDAAK